MEEQFLLFRKYKFPQKKNLFFPIYASLFLYIECLFGTMVRQIGLRIVLDY
jgi:hypothetical protein